MIFRFPRPSLNTVLRAIALTALCLAPSASQAQIPQVLTLEDALRIAHARQPQLRQARAATDAARARADQARSGLLPQVVGSAGYQRTTANFIPRPGVVPRETAGTGSAATSSWDTFNFFSGSVSVNQLVWDFDQTLGRWRATKEQAAAQETSERTVASAVALAVRSAFFDARAGKALVAVAHETLANLERHLQQTQGFVEAGTRPEIDLAQARTNLANGRAQLVSAENSYATFKAQLRLAMGIASSADFEIADQAPGPVEGEQDPIEQLVAEALKARPEIGVLERQVEAQRLTAHALRGAYGPTLTGNLGSTQGGTKLDSLGWNVSVGATLSWSLFQGGFTAAQVHEAEATTNQLAAQLESQQLQVRLDVEQAQLAVRAAKASLEAQNDAVVNARDQLRLAQARYETGVGSSIELSDAEVASSNAQALRVQADNQLAVARAQLVRALGRP